MLKNGSAVKSSSRPQSSSGHNVQSHLRKTRKTSTASLPPTKFCNPIIRSSIKPNRPDNGIRLRDSYYNDQNVSYLKKATSLMYKSKSYQSKPISQSIRKRIETDQAEEIADKRKNSSFYSIVSQKPPKPQAYSSLVTPRAATQRLPGFSKALPLTKNASTLSIHSDRSSKSNTNLALKTKISQSTSKKIKDQGEVKMKQRVLDNLVKQKLHANNLLSKQWTSPFKRQTDRQDFASKPLSTSKSIIQQQKLIEGQRDQLKVLNLDRLFKGNKQSLTSRIDMSKRTLSRPNLKHNNPQAFQAMKPNTINYIISDFNNLCKIQKLVKVKKIKPLIQGEPCLRQPTLQQLLGIKTQDLRRWRYQQQQYVSRQVFRDYCTYFRNTIRKEPFLVDRMIKGFIGTAPSFNLEAYMRFHQIFVSKSASLARKIEFLQYFFIPHKESLELQMFKLIMELLCEKLPVIRDAELESNGLSVKEKSSIFYETLMRVLVGPMEYKLKQQGEVTREAIKWIFEKNEESVDLILSLFFDRVGSNS